MTDKAADQLRRVLQLIPELADGEEHSVSSVASRLGVSTSTLLDDLVSLTERFDEPGGFVEGVTVIWDDKQVSALTPHFLRPMRLSMRELAALELGLALVRRERQAEDKPAVDRALARLREAISRVPANDLADGVRYADLDAPGSEHLATIRSAITARGKLSLTYRSGSATESTNRVVCPQSLAFAHGMWYLVAYCTANEGMRFFRLDRVEGLRTAEGTFERMAAELPEARFYSSGEQLATMTIRYSPRIARWIAEREGLELAADGSLTVERPMSDEHWAVRHVLQYGPEAEVLAPASLRGSVAERLKVMTEMLPL